MTLRVAPAELVACAEASGSPGLVGIAPWWGRVPLRDVASVVNGAAFKSVYFNRDRVGMPLVRIRDVGSAAPSTWYSGPWQEAHLVRRGDLLIGMDGDFRSARWAAEDGLLNQRVCRIDVHDSSYNARFLELLLPGYLEMIWAATSSTTVKHLSSRTIGDIPLPFPPIDEQRRIVELLEDHLSRLDAAQGWAKSAAHRVTAMRRSALGELFGGAGKQLVPLCDLVAGVQAGKSFGGANAPAAEGEWGIIKVSAMTWGEFKSDENKAAAAARVDPRFEIRAGDLLVSRANTSEYVGASVLVDTVRPRLLLSDKSMRLTPRVGVVPEWLWRVLQAPGVRRQISALATGTKDSMRNIAQQSLLKVEVPNVPQDQQFAALTRFREVDSKMTFLTTEITRTAARNAALRRAVLGATFSGRLTAQTPHQQAIAAAYVGGYRTPHVGAINLMEAPASPTTV